MYWPCNLFKLIFEHLDFPVMILIHNKLMRFIFTDENARFVFYAFFYTTGKLSPLRQLSDSFLCYNRCRGDLTGYQAT